MRRGVWRNFVKDVKEDMTLHIFEARLGDLDQPDAARRLGQNAIVIVLKKRPVDFGCKALEIGEPK